MNLVDWLNAVANEMNGWYEPADEILCVDTGDFGVKTYAMHELVQLYNTKVSPRVAADILRMGGVE